MQSKMDKIGWHHGLSAMNKARPNPTLNAAGKASQLR
jgi:hypothetical protein